jgi:hypothetical protein
MEYELYDTVLIIKNNNGFEATLDTEYLCIDEINEMLKKLEQNDNEVNDTVNLTFPTYDMTLPEPEKDINSFLQIKFDINKIFLLIQIDHSRYSTSFLQEFSLTESNKLTLIEMLNKLTTVCFNGSNDELIQLFTFESSEEDEESLED